jgi:hypothetical protein
VKVEEFNEKTTLRISITGPKKEKERILKISQKEVGFFCGSYATDVETSSAQLLEEAFHTAFDRGHYTFSHCDYDNEFVESIKSVIATIHDESEDITVELDIVDV